jgi:hypothetical protein
MMLFGTRNGKIEEGHVIHNLEVGGLTSESADRLGIHVSYRLECNVGLNLDTVLHLFQHAIVFLYTEYSTSSYFHRKLERTREIMLFCFPSSQCK